MSSLDRLTDAIGAADRELRLGIVVPLANEEETVEEFLTRVLAQLGERDRVFCVTDHASNDRTMERVAQIAFQDRRVYSIFAPENRSVVDAYFRGYREALAADCRWILEMDAGLSHQPEEIPRFLEAMESGVDFAAGSRFMRGGYYDGPMSRRLLSRGGTLLTRVLLGSRLHDMTSGFECFTQSALRHVVANGVRSRAHFFQTEIRWMLHDWQWVEVPISYRAPSRRMSSASVFEALQNLWGLARSRARERMRNTAPEPVRTDGRG